MKLICKSRKFSMSSFSNENVIATWDVSTDGKNTVISIKIDFDKSKGQLELLVDKSFLKKAVLIAKELDIEPTVIDEIF
ncbi:MAG: hypothetical protein ACFFDN_09250 [Candidatus Hodarchaeota archaeon]